MLDDDDTDNDLFALNDDLDADLFAPDANLDDDLSRPRRTSTRPFAPDDDLDADLLAPDANFENLLAPDDDLDNLLALDDESPGRISVDDLDLEKIPRHLWARALAPFHRSHRGYAAHRVADARLRHLAFKLVYELDMAEVRGRRERDVTRHRVRRTGAPLPGPDAVHAAAQPTAQVNIRLRRDDYERLHEAAAFSGLRPTTLARALVLNGVAKVLQERGAT
jgi:hypothetical protein